MCITTEVSLLLELPTLTHSKIFKTLNQILYMNINPYLLYEIKANRFINIEMIQNDSSGWGSNTHLE